jgi:hypothetical protein
VIKYIGEPYQLEAFPNNDMTDEWLANLVDAPVFRVWGEDPVHVTACEVVPVAAYDVVGVAQDLTASPGVLTIGTIAKPIGVHYGDVVGVVSGGVFTQPQGVVSVTDVSAYLIANQGGAPGTTPPPTTWVDLEGNYWAESCTGNTCTIPQAILNVADLGRIKFGFIGQTYSETPGHEDPGDCP